MKIQMPKSAAIGIFLVGCLAATDHAYNGIVPSPTLNLHIDADHTTQTVDYPDSGRDDLGTDEMTAQNSSDSYNHPGAYIYANNDYIIDNAVIGYAAGVDKFGNGTAGACPNFRRLLIEAGALDGNTDARFIFKYSASDPDLMTHTSNGPYVLPDDSALRIWTKDGDQVRSPKSAHLTDGCFIKADQEYTPAQLGWKSGDTYIYLYVEAVTDVLGIYPISVTYYPSGTSQPASQLTEEVKVIPVYLNRLNGIAAGIE